MGPFIWIAEDDQDDQLLFSQAFQDIAPQIKLTFLEDGTDLVELAKTQHHLPNLVILDVQMPQQGGLETLAILRSMACFEAIPIVLTSTSEPELSLADLYQKGASTFFVKPNSYEQLRDVVEQLSQYWTDL